MRVMILMLLFALIGVPAQVSADIDAGLIAWYPFDNGVVDKTGNIEPLEGESILPILKGKFGGAVKLDGDTFIAIPVDLGPDLNPSVTISLWVKTDPRPTDAELEKSLPSTIYVVSESIAVGNLNGDSAYFFGYALGRAIVGSKHTTRRGQWQHVALVRTIEDRPNAEGEIGPHLVSQFHSGGRMSELVVPFRGQGMGTDLYLGTNSPRYPSSFRFRGAVDELRIYDRALNQSEVNALASASTGSDMPTGTTASAVSGVPAGDASTGTPTDPPVTGAPPGEGGSPVVDTTVNAPPNESADEGETASPYAGILDANPISLSESEIDGLTEGVEDPDIEGRQYFADWKISRSQFEDPNGTWREINPGSKLTFKIMLEKDDSENKISDVRLEFDPGEGQDAIQVSVTENTSSSAPTSTREVEIPHSVPDDIAFPDGKVHTHWKPVVRILNRNGLELNDAVPDNQESRLTIPVRRKEKKTEVYVDQSVLRFIDPPYDEKYNDVQDELFLDDGGLLQALRVREGTLRGRPCRIDIASRSGAEITKNHCDNAYTGEDGLSIVLNPDETIVGLSVCRIEDGALEGVRVFYRKVNQNGEFGAATEFVEDVIVGGCHGWSERASCPPGGAASGLLVRINTVVTLPYVHSIALACGEVKVREAR